MEKTWSASEGTFQSWDGTGLFYRSWKPSVESKKALILIHRGHEHSGRLDDLFRELQLKDFWAFAWDARGHGQSPGERGYAPSFDCLVRDLDAFVKFVSQKYGISVENMAVVSNSVGSVIASTWVHDYAPPVRALVLAAPAFRIRLYVPFAVPGLRLLQNINGKAFISSYVKSKMLTHDEEQAKKYDEDKLITRNIAVNILLGLHDTSTRVLADAGAIVTPTLLLSAGSDWVVEISAQKKFFESLSSAVKEFVLYPGFFHAIFFEKDRQKPIAKTREFILEAFENRSSAAFLLKAHQQGYTKNEYDALCRPAGIFSSLSFGFQKFVMNTLGRLSDGISLGWETGFDSGKTLDYVYENKSRGKTFLGRAIDRSYLDSVGWKGIRIRGEHLKSTLKEAVTKINMTGRPVKICDLAAGPGRYVLSTVKNIQLKDMQVLLRDWDQKNLDAGQKIAASLGLSNISFEQGDAFNTNSIRNIKPRPNIIIVSGLYELFPDNDKVLDSLKGIAEVLEDGGYFIYTGQPWHPQVEMIARTLINRDQKPWIMRRRTQAEMDELVRSVGLKKLDMKIDEYGIFTVSVARKG